MMTKNTIKSYSELVSLNSYLERFRYLRIGGKVGEETFGYQRQVNQEFYHSREWLDFRDDVIIRDMGCDMGFLGYDITGLITVHHINPISFEDIVNRSPALLDLENAVCVSSMTHKAIHYGDEHLLICEPIIRVPYDTCPWKKKE